MALKDRIVHAITCATYVRFGLLLSFFVDGAAQVPNGFKANKQFGPCGMVNCASGGIIVYVYLPYAGAMDAGFNWFGRRSFG